MVRPVYRHKFSCKREVGSSGVESGTVPILNGNEPSAIEPIAAAQARGVTALYLLTTTATTFFQRVGYTAHDRANVPPSIAAATEFSSLCPDTADCLWRDLTT